MALPTTSIPAFSVKERTVMLLLLKPKETSSDTGQSAGSTGSTSFFITKQQNDFLKSKKVDQNKNLYEVIEGLQLENVTSIDISMEANTAVSNTIQSAIIYPWHFSTVSITLSGKSFLGSFGEDSKTTAGDSKTTANLKSFTYRDYEVDDVYNKILKQSIQFQTIVTTASTRKYPIRLLIKNNPPGLDDFIGFATRFNFKENESDPFILNYDISIVAKPWVEINNSRLIKRAVSGVI